MLLLMIASQFAGAFLGCLLGWLGGDDSLIEIRLRRGVNEGNGLFVEIYGTFMLTFLISFVKEKTSDPSSNIVLKAICVGATLTMVVGMGGKWSGAAYNPAIGIMTGLFNSFQGDTTGLEQFWVYLVGNTVGGILGGLWNRFVM